MKKSIVTLSLALAVASTGTQALARSYPGFHGKPHDPADASCFSENWGSVTNNCSTNRVLFFPLFAGCYQNYSAQVSAFGATSSNNVSCRILSNGPYGLNASPVIYLSQFGSTQSISLGTVRLSDGAANWISCWLDPGARINYVRVLPTDYHDACD